MDSNRISDRISDVELKTDVCVKSPIPTPLQTGPCSCWGQRREKPPTAVPALVTIPAQPANTVPN